MSTPKCVPDYDQLRKVDPPPGPGIGRLSTCDYVFVAGLPDPKNSGLQGFFEWRGNSTAKDNGGTVIKPNAIPLQSKGRWHRVFDGAISVKWFGAQGFGNHDDTPNIQTAIDSAASLQTPTVCFPPGRYRLTHAIRAEVDNLTLLGSAGAVLVADPLDDETFPEAIFAHKNFPVVPPDPVSRLTIQDFTIEVRNGAGGNISAGVVQLNHCLDCVVRNVSVKYTGPTPKPPQIDGIVASQGTTGLIQGCLVDGIPKAGIYAAPGTHDLIIDACEVRNTSGPIGQVGISISGSDSITVSNCLSHNNGRAGLHIGVNGPTVGNPPAPATNIQVIGGSYNDNTFEGILIASCANTVPPRNIQLVGVTAQNNDGRGISVEAGWDVLIASPTVVDSGAQGIWLENVPVPDFPNEPCDPSDKYYLTHPYRRPCDCLSPDANSPRTTRVQISNANVYNNGRKVNVSVPGIGLKAVDQVLITGGKLSKTPAVAAARRQDYGIVLQKRPISLPVSATLAQTSGFST